MESPPPPITPRPPGETTGLPFGIPWPRLGLSALGAYETGVRPTSGAGVLVAGALLWRYLRLEAIGGYWFERSVRFAAQPESGADVSLIAVGGRACPTYPWAVEASICAGLDLGQLRADPVALADESAGRSLWAAAILSAGIAWAPVELVAIRASGEAFFSLVRPSYEVMGFGEVHRPARFGGRGLLGIEVRFF